AMGMREEKLAQLEMLLRSRLRGVKGVVVVRKGYVVFEWYRAGCGSEDAHNVASVTKSVVSALVGIALEAGHLRSAAQKVLEFFPGYAPGPGDTRKRNLTVRHLLTMTAPVAWRTGAWDTSRSTGCGDSETGCGTSSTCWDGTVSRDGSGTAACALT